MLLGIELGNDPKLGEQNKQTRRTISEALPHMGERLSDRAKEAVSRILKVSRRKTVNPTL